MHSLLVLAGVFVTATLCQWAFAAVFAPWGIMTNLMLVFAVAACTRLKPPVGYALAFLCGLFLDFFGTKLFGNQAFVFSLCAWAVYCLEDRFDFESILPQVISVFCLSILAGLGNTVLLALFAGAEAGNFLGLLGGAVINALAALPVFYGVRSVFSKGIICKEN